jgi:ferric-dicitrate binding protein FerR (iron transport regulator)
MEGKGQYEVLLVKYLTGELDRQEESFITDWIAADEKNRAEFESLKKALDVLALDRSLQAIDLDAEWDELRKTIGTDEAKVISMLSGRIFPPQANEKRPVQRLLNRRLFWIGAAAVFLGISLPLTWKFFDNTVPARRDVVAGSPVDSSEMPVIAREVNTTNHARTLMLDDGTTVTLFANSELTYRKHFSQDKRDVLLAGKAQFAVAEDKARPFTVYAGDIRTQDIGTIFTVTAFKDEEQITVAVTEGKVVVSAVDKENSALKKEVFLSPGQELVYNRTHQTVSLKSAKNVTAQRGKEKTKIDDVNKNNPVIPKNYKQPWFMFNNQPLSEIFSSLALMYNAKIHYEKKDMEKLYFIGRFNKSDSLETILRQIATVNNLTVTQEGNTFTIKVQ